MSALLSTVLVCCLLLVALGMIGLFKACDHFTARARAEREARFVASVLGQVQPRG